MTLAGTADNTLKRLLSGPALPALPQSAVRVLELLKDPDCEPAVLAVPLESDPGLVSQVLRFVNSSYFGFAREISSVRTAISLVGVQTIENFVLWSAIFSSIPDPKSGTYQFRLAWYDSLKRAVFARSMAKLLRLPNAEDAFCAALLQDVTVPLLVKAEPEAYLELLERAPRDRSSAFRLGARQVRLDPRRCGPRGLPSLESSRIARRDNCPALGNRETRTARAGSGRLGGSNSLCPLALDGRRGMERAAALRARLCALGAARAPGSQDFLEDVECQLKDLLPLAGFNSALPPGDRRVRGRR